MHFDEPMWALALLALPLLGWGVWRWQTLQAERMQSLSKYAVGIPARSRWQMVCLLVALGALIIALCGPRWGRSAERVMTRSRNVMLVVDVSRSMLAEDVHPNRLGRAKADLIDLVDELHGDRAGLMVFRGKAVLLCPLTQDVAFLRQAIDALAPDSAPPGETDIADALAKALLTFDEAESGHNAIVLISDGEDLAGRAAALASEAGKRHIPVFTVGIGSASGATIPTGVTPLTHEGKTVTTRLTEATLQEIATLSGGRYVPLATAGTAQTTLGSVYRRYLARLSAADHEEEMSERLADRSFGFVVLAAVLILAAACGSLGRIAAAVAILALPTAVWAQVSAREAQAAWDAGVFEAAAKGYAEARVGAEPSAAARYAYNEALAQWQLQHGEAALDVLKLAYQDPDYALRSSELEGVIALALSEKETDLQKRLEYKERAIAAFNRALRAASDERTKRNLYRALDGVEQLRFDVRKSLALKVHEKKQLGQLIPELLTHQRGLMKGAPEVFTSTNPDVMIAQAEQLAKDVRTQADRWFPVMEQLPQAVEDEKLRTELMTRAQTAQAALDAAAERYEALEQAFAPLCEGEAFVYDVWKLVADPPALNNEAIAVQENFVKGQTPYMPTREDGAEVFALLQQFRLIFPQWAEEQLKQNQTQADGEPAFTVEDKDIILKTAADTIPLFTGEQTAEVKQKVLDNLKLIRDHLPKQGNNNRSQQQQDPNQQQQNQQSQSQEGEDQAQEPQEQPPESAPSEEESRQADQQATLQKASDREKEHEEEKRARARQTLAPTTRDW